MDKRLKDRKHKQFCSRHQVVHQERTHYWSCRWPNDKERDKKQKDWQNNPRSIE